MTSNVDLLRVVANELKLPLTNMQLTSAMLANSMYSEPEIAEQHQRLMISSQQAIELIDAILLAGRVQTNQTELILKPVSAASLARDVAEELKPLAARYDKVIRVTTSGSLSPANANPEALKASIKAMLDSVIRSSSSEVIDVVIHHRLDYIIVSLKDRGEPVSNRTVSTVLKNLGKSVQPAKSLPATSGLGVYVASVLMDAMNGKMDAYSASDKRTITLSLRKSEQLSLL